MTTLCLLLIAAASAGCGDRSGQPLDEPGPTTTGTGSDEGAGADGQAAGDGSTAAGSSGDGSSADGSAADGSGADGSAADGSTADGSGADGSAADGSGDGSAADGSGADGSGATTGGVDGDALVINEIMFDPKAVSDDFGEWVEIYNPTSAAVDLAGWTLRDQGSNHHVIADSVVVPADGYVVLGREADPDANGGVEVDYQYESFFLANAGDTVILEDAAGVTVDSVAYAQGGPWPELFGGVSIELVSWSADNALGTSWEAARVPFGAGDLGTPGGPNGGVSADFAIDGDVADHHQPALAASLYFSPNDPWLDAYLEDLAGAQSEVRLAYFNVRLDVVKWTLQALVEDGVDVRVVLDARQQQLEFNTMGQELAEAGIDVVEVLNESAELAVMHHKFTVIDGERVWTGSANLSSTATTKSDEDVLVVDDAAVAARFRAEFDELYGGVETPSALPDPDAGVAAYMGPEEDLDGKILDLIAGAQDSIRVAIFQINQSALIDALIERHQAGVEVIVILDGVYLAAGGAEDTLAEAGVAVVEADNELSQFSEMHSKFVIVDHERVAMGSFNWTNMASFHNDEALILLDDELLAQRAEGKFAEMVNRYASAEALGIETAPQTVTFTLTNLSPGVGTVPVIQTLGGGPFPEPTPMANLVLSAQLDAGLRVDYHYGVQNPDGTVAWETGAAHAFQVPYAPGPFTVLDAFRP